MSRNPHSKSTAIRENALSAQEIATFLDVRQDARLATNRGDGWRHLTRIWCRWDGERFHHTLGAARRHLCNLRSDPHVTVCVDEDPRLTDRGARRGRALRGLLRSGGAVHRAAARPDATWEILRRNLGDEADQYIEPILAEGRTIVTLTPQLAHLGLHKD